MTAMTRRQAIASIMAASAAAGGCAGPTPQAAPASESLHAIAARRGLRFGTAIGMGKRDSQQAFGFDNDAYRRLVARECGLIVHENELKWRALRPSPREFRFEQADSMLAWAQSQQLQVRGHTLLWQAPKWLPDWLPTYDFGARPVQEAERLLGEHIATVCRRYGKQIASWDVVNESIAHETGEQRDNAFTPHLGNLGQIELAFRVAHEHAPHAQLVYNDYMGWGSFSVKHRAGVLKLLHQLKSRGVPVHALGLQAHLGTGEDGKWVVRGGAPEREWRAFLDEVTAMGLDLLITELDVNDRHLPQDFARRDADVAAVARDFLDVTLSYTQLRDVMAWGLADNYSWLQTFSLRADGQPKRPCPYDAQLRAKPLREALAAALAAAPMRPARAAAQAS